MHRFLRWRELIQSAQDQKTLQRVMKDYVDTIPPEGKASLPPDCQAALLDDDIQAAAVTFLHCELTYSGDPQVAELLHEIAHTFAAASTRLNRLGPQPLAPAE